jgi:hypothetical protein
MSESIQGAPIEVSPTDGYTPRHASGVMVEGTSSTEAAPKHGAETPELDSVAKENVPKFEFSEFDNGLSDLTRLFAESADSEHLALALDELDDFCENHGLTSAQRKVLRNSLLLEKPTLASGNEVPVSEVVVDETLKSEAEAKEPVATVAPNEDVAQQAGDQLESLLTTYGMAAEKPADDEVSTPEPELAKETPVFSVGDYVIVEDEATTYEGRVTEIVDDPKDSNRIKYWVEYEHGKVLAHKEDLKKAAEAAKIENDDPEVVWGDVVDDVPEDPAPAPEEVIEGEVIEPAEEVAEEPAEDAASVDPEDATITTKEKTPWEKAKALPLAASVAISQYLNAQKEKWNALPPEKKKRYKIIGGIATAAVVITAAYFVAKGFDSGVDANTGAEAGGTGTGTESSGGVNAGDASTGGGPDAGPSISEAAQTVEKGEGWFQTFEEMGIKSTADQKALLNEIGPKLVKMGAAYSAPELGGFGISSSGELPTDAIKLIQSVGEARGYIS